MDITEITPVPPIDFTDQELENGDSKAFVTKMNQYMSKLEIWSNSIHAQASDLGTMRNQIQTALNSIETIANSSLQESFLLEELEKVKNERMNLFNRNGQLIERDLQHSGVTFDNNSPFSGGQDLQEFFVNYNGSNVEQCIEVDRWIYNSSSNGGSNDAISTFVQNVANAMGYSELNTSARRFIPTYAFAEILAGDQTFGTSYNGLFRFMRDAEINKRAAVNGEYSLSFWYQARDGDSYIGRSAASRSIWVDGEFITIGNSQDGIVFPLLSGHVYHIATAAIANPFTSLPNTLEIYAPPESRHRIWLPRAAAGVFKMNRHLAPIPTGYWLRNE